VPVEKVCPQPIEIQLVGASGAEGVGDEGEPTPDLLDVLVGPLGELEQSVLADPRARVRVLDAIAQGGARAGGVVAQAEEHAAEVGEVLAAADRLDASLGVTDQQRPRSHRLTCRHSMDKGC
jgi:hypothetical protein